ncbi:MAG: hypothetical protein CL678_08545 [Bdellovibrionaceae bacterium]|nr:hypothetical protein [Pseudobdellovibrionaceae bacterium]
MANFLPTTNPNFPADTDADKAMAYSKPSYETDDGYTNDNYPGSIGRVYIQTFEQNVRVLAQQMDSKLIDTVTVKSVGSQMHNWDRIGKMEVEETPKLSNLQETPNKYGDWSRRVSVAQTWNMGTSVEQENPIQMLIDPQSALTREVAYAMRRKIDRLIISAATGTVQDGLGASVTWPVTTPGKAGYNHGIDHSGQKITFDMLTEVQEMFMNATIDPDIPKVAVVSPSQVRTMMQLTQQTSADFVHREALQRLNATGIVPNWMGFKWIVSTLLQDFPGTDAGTTTQCLFYTEKALGMQMNRDITVRIAEDPTKSFAWRLYAYMTNAALRVQDEQIVTLGVKN